MLVQGRDGGESLMAQAALPLDAIEFMAQDIPLVRLWLDRDHAGRVLLPHESVEMIAICIRHHETGTVLDVPGCFTGSGKLECAKGAVNARVAVDTRGKVLDFIRRRLEVVALWVVEVTYSAAFVIIDEGLMAVNAVIAVMVLITHMLIGRLFGPEEAITSLACGPVVLGAHVFVAVVDVEEDPGTCCT